MRLTDCFIDLLGYTAYLIKSVGHRQQPFEQVQADIRRLLGQSESLAKRSNASPEDYDLARFAVCAWVDEMILASDWRQKDRWQREQLQRIYYNTADAGEQFFDRLNNLGFQHRDVRELYYLCMSLGFMGKYIHEGDEYLLQKVREANLKWLLGSSVGVPSFEQMELFPEAYPKDSAVPGGPARRYRPSVWSLVAIACPLVLYGALYLFYNQMLSQGVQKVLQVVG
jgi:type VI secretion system protein ImpK